MNDNIENGELFEKKLVELENAIIRDKKKGELAPEIVVMSKEKMKFFSGIIYIILVLFEWLILLIMPPFVRQIPFNYTDFLSGWLHIVGVYLLIPSTMLYTSFAFSKESSTRGKFGFIFGIPAWFLLIIGTILGLSGIFMGMALVALIISIPLVCCGCVIFALSFKVK